MSIYSNIKKKINRIGYTGKEFNEANIEAAKYGFELEEIGNGKMALKMSIKENIKIFENIASASQGTKYEDFFKGIEKFNFNSDDDIDSDTATPYQTSYKDSFITKYFGDPHKILDKSYDDGRDPIKYAMDILRKDHFVRQVTEMMSQFSNSRLSLRSKKTKELDFYNRWMRSVRFRKTLGKIFKAYYGTSNVTIFKFTKHVLRKNTRHATVSYSNESKDMYKMMYPNGIDLSERKNSWSKNRIPMMYTVLNPLLVENRSPAIIGMSDSYYSMDSKAIKSIKNYFNKKAKESDTITKEFPPGFIRNILDYDVRKTSKKFRLTSYGQIKLEPEYAIQIFREKDDWDKYALPISWNAIPALHMKNKLREMDIRIINSVIDKILVVTIGSSDNPATPKQMSYMAKLLSSDTKVLTLLWNHTLKLEYVEPNMDSLNIKKYESVNQDIREAFGAPGVLLGGSGTNFSSTFIEVKGFIEKLATGREDILDDFILGEFEQIAETMRFDNIPLIEFEPIKLRDENKIFDQMIKLVERGGISVQTLSESSGYNWDQEKKRRTDEVEMRKADIIPAVGVPGADSKNGSPGVKPPGGRPNKDLTEPEPDGDLVKKVTPKGGSS